MVIYLHNKLYVIEISPYSLSRFLNNYKLIIRFFFCRYKSTNVIIFQSPNYKEIQKCHSYHKIMKGVPFQINILWADILQSLGV